MKKILCPLCNNSTFTVLYSSTLKKEDFNPEVIKNNLKNTLDDYRKHAQIVRCKKCNLVYTNPMEDMKSVLKGYKDVVDEEYLINEKYRKKLSAHHLETLEKTKQKGSLLDVGCFAGFFLEIAKKKGWKTYGIEPSSWAATIAKKKGINILGRDIEGARLKQNSFDAITLWDVIEHLPNPQKVIKIIHKALKRDGVVALGTPNIESLLSKILKDHYPYLIRMHIILYSPQTLRKLLEENGFKVLHISTYGRLYPLGYVVDRIRTNKFIFSTIKKIIHSYPIISNFVVHINLRDEFVIIAKKTS